MTTRTGPVGSARRTAVALVRPAPALFAVQGLLSVLTGLLVPVSAWVLADLLGRVAGGQRGPAVGLAALGLAAATGAVPVSAHLARYLQAEFGRRVTRHAKADLWLRVNRIPDLRPLEDPPFLDRLRAAQQAGTSAPQAVAQAVFGGLRTGATVVGLGAALASVAPWLVVAAVLACAPAGAAALLDSRRRAAMMWRATPHTRRELFYAALMTDSRAAKEIRLFGAGGFMHTRMLAEIDTVAGAERALDRRALRSQGLLAAAGAVIAGAALLWTALRAGRGQLSVAQLSLAAAALTGLQAGAGALVRSLADGYRGLLVFNHFLDLDRDLAGPTDVAGPTGLAEPTGGAEAGRAGHGVPPRPALPTPPLRDGIELRAVSFGYPGGPPVLRDVSLRIPAGATVALVGVNGAGKSSLIKLLCRFYAPTSGVVLWDGIDASTLEPRALRSRISAVFQDFMCYDLSAAENVGLGDLGRLADRPALRRAAGAAAVDATLAALPDGYDTMLSRAFAARTAGPGTAATAVKLHGAQLSGGQWQRVAVARALLRHDADLLILDEPSAGLDPDAEAALLAGIGSTRRAGSTLLISHRLSVVRRADLIVVLSGGRVLEQGDHGALMAAGGEYARMFALQAAGYQPAGAP